MMRKADAQSRCAEAMRKDDGTRDLGAGNLHRLTHRLWCIGFPHRLSRNPMQAPRSQIRRPIVFAHPLTHRFCASTLRIDFRHRQWNIQWTTVQLNPRNFDIRRTREREKNIYMFFSLLRVLQRREKTYIYICFFLSHVFFLGAGNSHRLTQRL